MRRLVGAIIVLACLALLVHDTASGRLRTFRPLRDERYYEAFYVAMEKRHSLAEMRWLVRMLGGIHADAGGNWAPLHEAAFYEHAGVARLFISLGADVNRVSTDGVTPLHEAVQYGRIGVVPLLIAHGADVNARGKCGDTPLDLACGEDMAALLRQHGGKTGKELDQEKAK